MVRKKDNRILFTIVLTLLAAISVVGCVFVYETVSHQNIPTSVITDKKADLVVPTEPTAPPTITPAPEKQTREFAWSAADVQTVNTMLQGFGGQIAFYYEDLESGYIYSHNADQVFSAASLMKAPFCLFILQLASEGKCDLSQTVTYTAAFQSEGTGIIKNAAFGTQYTIEQLIEYAIRYSDNAALRMLRSVFSVDEFKTFAASIGISDTNSIKYLTNSNITATDAAIYLHAIYDFIEKDEVYGGKLYQYMTTTRNPMFRSSYPLLRKYGWTDIAFHDIGIVYAPHPYIIVLLTDHQEGTAADFAMFHNIATTIEKISGQTE